MTTAAGSGDGPRTENAARRPLSWVIGAGGLLGSALTRRLRANGDAVFTSSVAWGSGRADGDLLAGTDRLVAAIRTSALPWRVVWCAGAGVIGTSEPALLEEVRTVRAFLRDLAGRSGIGTGTVFVASSAGGLYAGARGGAPFDERDTVAPVSVYGLAKLEIERVAARFGQATGHRVLIGRISNLYGPGQNLTKPQGLISQLCRGSLIRQPISVYVSLDTIRDYLYVDDCADRVADLLDLTAPDAAADRTVVKVIATAQGTTIGALLAMCRQVLKRSPLVVLGTSPSAHLQVKDLRLRSVVLPQLDRRSLTPLPVGIAATARALLRTAQLGSYPADR